MSTYYIEYIEDKKSHKWLPFKSDGKFDVVMQSDASTAWCDYHSRWEKFTKNEKGVIIFQCGYKSTRPLSIINTKSLSSVMFKIDMDNLKLDVSFRQAKPSIYRSKKVIEKHSEVSHFNFADGSTLIEHVKKNQIYFDNELDLEQVPQEIQESIQNVLSLMTKKIFGVPCKNTYKLCQNGFKHFVMYPSCPPISIIKPCFKTTVKRFNLHAFEDLCKTFEVNPTKKFRKMFMDNPSVLLVNVFLNCIGFKDPNVYNKYYDNAALIGFLEENLSCDEKLPGLIKFFDSNECMYALRLWYQNSTSVKSDTVRANHLIEPILNGRTETDILKDAMSLYVQNFNAIPDPLKKRIIKEGFTDDVHNRLCEALHHSRIRKGEKNFQTVEYTEEELKLQHVYNEDDKERFLFELPKSTDDLYLISDKMHNCVGYLYRTKVLSKQCYIVTLEDKKIHRGVACIEIRESPENSNLTIVQALGPCNRRIEKEYIPIIQKWMKLKHIKTTLSDLSEERNI